MSKVKYKFPEEFLWGSASSGTQTEGGALEGGRKSSIWDYWYELEPNRFHNQVGLKIHLIFIINIKKRLL